MDDLELRVAWQQHVAIDLGEFEAVLARHREPHRRYHGERHVRWVVRHAQQLAAQLEAQHADGNPRVDLGAVIAAAFYHDAVYDPQASDNELASARLACDVLKRCGWDAGRADAVANMIEATAGHTDSSIVDAADLSTAVLLAADLAVLAADPAGYNTYVNGIRVEYSHVAEPDWVIGRSAVLHRFIDRDRIFPEALALEEWEARARANIAAELAALDRSD